MNVDFLSNKADFISQLRDRSFVVNQINSIEESSQDILVVGDDVLEYTELSTLPKNKYNYIFYVLTNDYEPGLEKAIKAVCDSYGFVMVSSKLTTNQVIDEIQKTVSPVNTSVNSNVVSFFSVVPNIGTTSTTLSVAKAIASKTQAKVGVLVLNAWDDGTDQLEYKGNYLDDIKSKLQNHMFSKNSKGEQEFLTNFHMEIKERLYILGGNRNTRMQRLYTKDEIYYLIELSKEAFDIVLIDAGSHFDNAGMVQSLKESDMKFLIVNQQRKCLKKFQEVNEDILYPLGFKKSDFLMIVNQYREQMLLPTSKDIFHEINVPLITTIEELKNGLTAEVNQKTLYEFNDISYNESIDSLLRTISANCSIEIIESTEKKRKWPFGIGGR
ncbi:MULTISPECIES: hypothetical protein [Bacilli]|uniref:hypothetical protein n=1 Tax=Bacilli TaxID=91061 RepID=UPI00203C27CD|nr:MULTISPECIES: hypothetical protein [Bacilli]MCM3032961.1 hypothetical protein [Niallia sp. MER 6]MDK8746831.1 hypothetical protein [Streptococcus agalactiae]